jgi:hypothetical protein
MNVTQRTKRAIAIRLKSSITMHSSRHFHSFRDYFQPFSTIRSTHNGEGENAALSHKGLDLTSHPRASVQLRSRTMSPKNYGDLRGNQ